MTGAELTQNVQFTVDQGGHVTAVVLDPTLWRCTPDVTALEDAEDRARVQALGGRCLRAWAGHGQGLRSHSEWSANGHRLEVIS